MPKNELIKMLSSLFQVSEGLQLLLKDKNTLRKQPLKKNEMLCRPFGNADEAHYIHTGRCKVYWKNSDNEEMIFGFFGENEIALLPEEFILESPNEDMYLETLTETVVYTITKAQMKKIYEEYPEAMVLTNMIVTNIYRKRKRQLWILLQPEGTRYEWFCAYFPKLRHVLADKDVAGFLGVSRSTLARSKRELFLKDWGRK